MGLTVLMTKDAHQRTCTAVLRGTHTSQTFSSCRPGSQLKPDRSDRGPSVRMEDFEYSVQICDRDWECFFTECEECNLLPPSLAGVDDSGMSDMDDTGCILGNRDEKVGQTAGLVEAERSIDDPPDSGGSPVELYFSKHSMGGLESVLSGSEEDIHLQSVNMFFERLKSLTEAEKMTEPNQVGARKNKEAAAQEEEQCSGGQPAKCTGCSLPKNIPKLNFVSARGETVVGRETVEAVNTVSNINTMKTDEPGSKSSPEPSASNSMLHTYKSAHTETELFIGEEACTANRVYEIIESNDSQPRKVVWSQVTPHSNKVINLEEETRIPLGDVTQEGVLRNPLTLIKSQHTDSSRGLDAVTKVKCKEDKNETSSKASSLESSPSASVKRKRRKKRRLSVEPAESALEYEKDSEEEQVLWKGRPDPCLPQDLNLPCLREPLMNHGFTPPLYTCLVTNGHPVNVKEKRVKDLPHSCNIQHLKLQDGVFKQVVWTENITRDDRFAGLQSPSDYSVVSAQSNAGNVATDSQPCGKLNVKDGLSGYPGMTLSISDCERDKSTLTTENRDCEREDTHAQSLELPNKMNHSFSRENEQSCTDEVFPSAESNDPDVEVCQHDTVSTAKSVTGVETGTSAADNLSQCQGLAELQQLETGCHDTHRYSYRLENTNLHSMSGSDVQEVDNTATLQLKTTSSSSYETDPTQSVNFTPDGDSLSLDKNPSSVEVLAKQIEQPPDGHQSSEQTRSIVKHQTTERAEGALAQAMGEGHCPCGVMNQIGNGDTQTHPEVSADECPSECFSSNTLISTHYPLETQSVESLSNENSKDALGSPCSSRRPSDTRCEGRKSQILTTAEKREGTSQDEGQDGSYVTDESNCDSTNGVDVSTARSEVEIDPVDSRCSVFAMSSFWREMEKLTINDILGLRAVNNNPPSLLPPLQESQDTDLSIMDSGFFSQVDESNQGLTGTEESTVPDPVDSHPSSVTSSKSVMWVSEPVPVSLPDLGIYPASMTLTSASDVRQPVSSGGTPKSPKKISKNVSVHNLRALESESFNHTYRGQALLPLEEEECANLEYVTDEHIPKQDLNSLPSVSAETYRISLTDLFQYVFGGKQSVPSQPSTETITSNFTDGNSVPETYDHFFSEFDTDTFFYPLIAAADEPKKELVPIFSCSRSANRTLQFPEAYDYFFVSSSSDDSSDEEDKNDHRPVRVVTRLSRKASANKISTDVYDNFFTDNDLTEDFFWPKSFSFRNVRLTGCTSQKQNSDSLPMRVMQKPQSLRRIVTPISALGNQDCVPDPLVYHLEERISKQLQQRPFRYEDLQTAVANPRLDSALLPLRHSDMCLVCIAFASWVLKTANPQDGDTWKAVLLANVSALSAIRYLRRYVNVEAAVSDNKTNHES